MSASRTVPYRPDIDGLRAIAVLSVVIFHAFPSVLGGGFIGVDIFFVISGYLITGILFKEKTQGRYSLAHFYARRVRRIFPALLAVLLFSLGLGWLALTADEYQQLSRHAGGGAVFINNFVSWRESGYFDNPGETKPLMHLWSLAIEEQFYLFWPLIFSFLLKRPERILQRMAWLGLLSLAYSVYLVQTHPIADFFSPLSRFWELLAGGWLACWCARRPGAVLPGNPSLWGGLGALLIGVGLLAIDKQSLFPGAWALLPVAGAGLLIASEQAWVNRHVLAQRWLVGVGLISYPLYLWHWPLISFARIFEGGTPSVAVRAGLVTASVVLAWLSYRWVERPVQGSRHGRLWVGLLVLAMLGVFGVSLNIKLNHGYGFRQFGKLNGDAASLVIGADRGTHSRVCGLEQLKLDMHIEWCTQDNKLAHPNRALLGDSKGEALFFGLSRESSAQESWMMIGPVNFLGGYASGLPKSAMDRVSADPLIKTVVLGNALRGFTPLNPSTGFIDDTVTPETIDRWVQAYGAAIAHLQAAGKKVVLVADNPTFPDPNSCISGDMTPYPVLNHLVYRNANPYCEIKYSDHLKGVAPYHAFLRQLQALHPDLLVFDPATELCDLAHDRCAVTQSGQFLYSYGDHISDLASSRIARKLLPLIDGMAAPRR